MGQARLSAGTLDAVLTMPRPRGTGLTRSRIALVAVLVLVFSVVGTHTAGAATYTTSCPTTDDACKATDERLEAQNALLEATNTKLDTLHSDLTASPGTTDIAGTVALAPDEQERLDLVWYGVWLLCGITLVLIVAPMFVRAFRFWH